MPPARAMMRPSVSERCQAGAPVVFAGVVLVVAATSLVSALVSPTVSVSARSVGETGFAEAKTLVSSSFILVTSLVLVLVIPPYHTDLMKIPRETETGLTGYWF